MGWMLIPFLFLLRPFPISRYCATHVSPIPFFLPLNLATMSGEALTKLSTAPSEK